MTDGKVKHTIDIVSICVYADGHFLSRSLYFPVFAASLRPDGGIVAEIILEARQCCREADNEAEVGWQLRKFSMVVCSILICS